MYKVVYNEDSLYIIQELERLGMNDKFRDEYDVELVNRTLMESLKDKGYNVGFNDGNLQGKKEIARNLLRENIDINIISKTTGLSVDKILDLKN
jgi:predicted transposase/invertase (TIGR01784 family)